MSLRFRPQKKFSFVSRSTIDLSGNGSMGPSISTEILSSPRQAFTPTKSSRSKSHSHSLLTTTPSVHQKTCETLVEKPKRCVILSSVTCLQRGPRERVYDDFVIFDESLREDSVMNPTFFETPRPDGRPDRTPRKTTEDTDLSIKTRHQSIENLRDNTPKRGILRKAASHWDLQRSAGSESGKRTHFTKIPAQNSPLARERMRLHNESTWDMEPIQENAERTDVGTNTDINLILTNNCPQPTMAPKYLGYRRKPLRQIILDAVAPPEEKEQVLAFYDRLVESFWGKKE